MITVRDTLTGNHVLIESYHNLVDAVRDWFVSDEKAVNALYTVEDDLRNNRRPSRVLLKMLGLEISS